MSKPDGYTLLISDRTWQAVAQVLFKELPYDPNKDFSQISPIASTPNILLAHPSVPAASLEEFVAYALSRRTEPRSCASSTWAPRRHWCATPYATIWPRPEHSDVSCQAWQRCAMPLALLHGEQLRTRLYPIRAAKRSPPTARDMSTRRESLDASNPKQRAVSAVSSRLLLARF